MEIAESGIKHPGHLPHITMNREDIGEAREYRFHRAIHFGSLAMDEVGS
jgi:hypothetical protein